MVNKAVINHSEEVSLYESTQFIIREALSHLNGDQALYEPEGLDIDRLLAQKDPYGSVTSLYPNRITNQELLVKPCDILIPAAISNQITEENAGDIQAKIVVEAANGPTTLKATEILKEIQNQFGQGHRYANGRVYRWIGAAE